MSPPGPSATPPEPGDPPRLEDFRTRLTDEYKILQDKIDKIGAFRFTIKGWSVTAVIAASATSNGVHSLLALLVISFGLAALMFFFFRMEFEQIRLRAFFGYRAKKLEKAFVQLDRGHRVKVPFAVPNLATEVESNSRSQRMLDKAHRKRRWILWRASDMTSGIT